MRTEVQQITKDSFPSLSSSTEKKTSNRAEHESQELIVNVSFCRCCFKTLTSKDVQHPVTGESLTTFQDIISIALEPCSLAQNFCNECFITIKKFDQFKKLAILKQKRFDEIKRNEPGNMFDIQKIKVDSDPLSIVKKEEDQPYSSIVIEPYSTIFQAPSGSSANNQFTESSSLGSSKLSKSDMNEYLKLKPKIRVAKRV